MGKTVTSYPPARGENSLQRIKGAELPQSFIFGLCPGKTKPGRGQEKQAVASARGLSPVSRQQRGCSCACSVPDGQLARESVSPPQVNWSAGQQTMVWCDDKMQTGKGSGARVAASPALTRIPCVILGQPFPAPGLRSPLLV